MSDMEVTPDPIVRTALQLLPVPPHEPAFWSRLDVAIDEAGGSRAQANAAERRVLVGAPASAPPAASMPPVLELEPDPALALVPPSLRRTSNAVLLAVAAAAVVVVALAGNTLLEDRTPARSGGAGDVAPSAALETLVSDAQPDASTPSSLSRQGADASSDAVLAWVADLGTGDGEGAWQAMGSASKAHFGTLDAFEAEMSSLSEGYGAWSVAEPEDVLVTPVLDTDDGTIAVVTLVGNVEQEGTMQRRADAFPVRIADGKVVLEPFAFAGALEVVVPDEAPVTMGEELVIVVPSDAEAPILRLDDGATIVCGETEGSELTDLEGSPGQRCSYLPPEGIGAGEHTLTMAFIGSDGTSISAGSLLFDAA